jgi:tetratricopeptide (TPR) repeat protein
VGGSHAQLKQSLVDPRLDQRTVWDWVQDKYTEALSAAPESAAEQRAVYLGNRAACQLKLRQFAEAAQDCSQALELSPAYTKVLLRRSTAYEEVDDLERALADAQKVTQPLLVRGLEGRSARGVQLMGRVRLSSDITWLALHRWAVGGPWLLPAAAHGAAPALLAAVFPTLVCSQCQ